MRESKGLLFLLGLLLVIVMNGVFALVVSTIIYFVGGGYESYGGAVLHGVTIWMFILGIDKLLRDALDFVKTMRGEK